MQPSYRCYNMRHTEIQPAYPCYNLRHTEIYYDPLKTYAYTYTPPPPPPTHTLSFSVCRVYFILRLVPVKLNNAGKSDRLLICSPEHAEPEQ